MWDQQPSVNNKSDSISITHVFELNLVAGTEENQQVQDVDVNQEIVVDYEAEEVSEELDQKEKDEAEEMEEDVSGESIKEIQSKPAEFKEHKVPRSTMILYRSAEWRFNQ